MTDQKPHDVSRNVECGVYHSILQKDLEQLLAVVSESLKFGERVVDPETQLAPIYPEWLDPQFVRERSSNNQTPRSFYLDPRLKKSTTSIPPHLLSLEDVVMLFYSIDRFIDENIRRGKYADVDILDEAQNNLLNRIKGEQVAVDIDHLRSDSQLLFSIITRLNEEGDHEDGPAVAMVDFPPEFKALIESELNLPTSWDWVKPLVEDVYQTRLNAESVVFRYDGGRISVKVIEVRQFLNTWLKRLYDDYIDEFKARGLPLPDRQIFEAASSNALKFDLDVWVESDRQIATFIFKNLTPVIDAFLKTKAPEKKDTPYLESTENIESGEGVTLDVKDDELDDLVRRFDEAGKSYRQETERLTTILLPQFFAMHGISRNAQELLMIDGVNYQLVEREFRIELENVLRSLSPAELDLLNQRGASLEFRVLVLRKLYGKLSTNPRFIGSIKNFKDKYVEKVQELVDQGQTSETELLELNKKANLSDPDFDEQLYNSQVAAQNWAKPPLTSAGTVDLIQLGDLHNITQADFERLSIRVSNGSLNSRSIGTLLTSLDLLIAERWSPDQIRGLSSPGEAYAVFGVTLPDAITQDSTRFHIFLQLCAEYLYARRQRLADHYQLDVISRDDGKTTGDLASLAAARALAEEHAADGGAEALIVARASDTRRVAEYSSGGHQYAKGIVTIHSKLKEDRQAKLDSDHQQTRGRFHDMSIDDKRALLESLGVLTNDLVEINNDPQSLERALTQRFEEAHGADYKGGVADLDNLSFYEDQDGGVAQEGGIGEGVKGTPQRYGRPGGKSLLKGALDIRRKYNRTQKRLKTIKKYSEKILKPLDKASELVAARFIGPLAKNRLARTAFLGGAAVAIAHFIQTILSSAQAAAGAFVGGLLGAGLSIATGGVAPAIITIPLGSFLGAKAGEWLAGQGTIVGSFGGGGSGLGSVLPTFTPAAPAAVVPATATATATGTSTGALGGSGGPGSGALAIGATSTYVIGTAVMSISATAAAFQPPPMSTITAGGLDSPYVLVEKVTTGPNVFPDVVPSEITYRISIRTQGDYTVEIINFQDEFTITPNQEKRAGESAPAALSCPNLNVGNLQNRIVTPADGSVLIGECTVPLDQTYHDTGIFNKFTVQFKVTENGEVITNESPDPACGESSDTFCAISGQTVCLGECPAQQEGCWPMTGRLWQGPYGSYSHSVVDAFDIGGAPVDREQFATFDGTAWAFDANSSEPSQQGLAGRGSSKIYGKHVILVTNQGFNLVYAHMNRHGSSMVLGQGVPVTAGTILGYNGNSGSSPQFQMDVHLHYEYRSSTGTSWYGISPKQPEDPLSLIVPQPFVYSEGMAVETCYPSVNGI